MAKATFTLTGLDEYLSKIQAAGNDIDDAVAAGLVEAGPLITNDVHKRLRDTSEEWTGSTDSTISQSEPQREGNYTFIEIAVDTSQDPAGFYDEYGTARQAAEPFFRPAFANMRHAWRNKMKEVLKRLGAI